MKVTATVDWGRLLSFVAVSAVSYVSQHHDYKRRSIEYKRYRLVHRHTHHHLYDGEPSRFRPVRANAPTRTLPFANKILHLSLPAVKLAQAK
jgi:hypothetical protein